MQKKSIKLCGFTAIMGVFGAFIRWVQNISAFELETELAIPNAAWSYVLFFFLLFTSIILVFAVRSFKKESFPTDFAVALSSDKRAVGIISAGTGVLMALGGAIMLIQSFKEPSSVFGIITGSFALVCAICFAALLRSTRRDHANTRGSSAALLIVLFLCFWLISTYKEFSSDPVIWHYAPRLLAVSATILAFYYIAGYPYRKPRPLLSILFCQLGTFFLIVNLADSFALGERLIALSFAVMMLLLTFVILSRACSRPGSDNGAE